MIICSFDGADVTKYTDCRAQRADIDGLTVLEYKVKVSAAWFLLRLWGGIPSRPPPGSVVCWRSSMFLACKSVTQISVFILTWRSPCVRVCVQIPPFYRDTSQTRNHPRVALISTLITYAMTLFPEQVTFWGTGQLGLQQMALEGGHHSTPNR